MDNTAILTVEEENGNVVIVIANESENEHYRFTVDSETAKNIADDLNCIVKTIEEG